MLECVCVCASLTVCACVHVCLNVWPRVPVIVCGHGVLQAYEQVTQYSLAGSGDVCVCVYVWVGVRVLELYNTVISPGIIIPSVIGVHTLSFGINNTT